MKPTRFCFEKTKSQCEDNYFHSNTTNLNYIKKEINYNFIINNKIKNKQCIVFRITFCFTKKPALLTYPPGYNTSKNNKDINKNFNGILDINITKLINYLLKFTIPSLGCYILYKYSKNIVKILTNDYINDNQDTLIKDIFNNDNTPILSNINDTTYDNSDIENNKIIYSPQKMFGGDSNYFALEHQIFKINDVHKFRQELAIYMMKYFIVI